MVRLPVNIAGFILAMMAGWVDTVGVYIFLDENSSFLTGRVAKLGTHLLKGEILKIREIMMIIVFFIVGSYFCTLITKRKGFTLGLSFVALLVLLTPFISLLVKNKYVALITIPMGMGGQNAATSLTPIGRTTHLTGPATDIGINLAHGNWKAAAFWMLRWGGFFAGVIIAGILIKLFEVKTMDPSYFLIIPGVIILLTGLIQKRFFDITLMEN